MDKARLKKAEQAAQARTDLGKPRLFVYFTHEESDAQPAGEITGTVEGETMTLAEWLKVKKPNDTEVHVNFVDEQPVSTVTMGRYSANVGIDASKL